MGASRLPALIASDEVQGGALPIGHPAAMDIFLAWLLWLPADRDLASAAAQEIRKIDRSTAADRTTMQLRAMLEATARAGRHN
jgi:hypothetical protein